MTYIRPKFVNPRLQKTKLDIHSLIMKVHFPHYVPVVVTTQSVQQSLKHVFKPIMNHTKLQNNLE